MKINVTNFTGIFPKISPRYLPDGSPEFASGAELTGRSLKPICSPAATGDTVPAGTETLYVWGNTLGTQQTLAFSSDVDIVRGQIADDLHEWTFKTDGGTPQATYAGLAPSWTTLGVAAPTSAPTVSQTKPADPISKPVVLITPELFSQFSKSSSNRWLLYFQWFAEGSASDVFSIDLGPASTPLTGSAIAAKLNANAAFAGVMFASSDTAGYVTIEGKYANPATSFKCYYKPWDWFNVHRLREGASDFSVTLSADHFNTMDYYLGVALNYSLYGAWQSPLALSNGNTPAQLAAWIEGASAVALSAEVIGESLIITATQPHLDGISISWALPETQNFMLGESVVGELNPPESRTYIYTRVVKTFGREMESAPSPASGNVDVYLEDPDDNPVTISGITANGASHIRVYRAAAGQFLFVREYAAASSVQDSTPNDELGEVCPSLTWDAPPYGLKGLINLPNGMMAAFKGRDVYFCEPYRPHAWPSIYRQTVEHTIVGLGRMDTTLAVLTEEVPYFMQGAHPDSVVSVKSDIQQACVSKRSIVSYGGRVVYASPDGLVSLSPGGSQLLTEALVSREQWSNDFSPQHFKAFAHDNRYYAFGISGGIVYDFSENALYRHNELVSAGFVDAVTDALLLVAPDGALKLWGGGDPSAVLWRSKPFVLPHETSFGWLHILSDLPDCPSYATPFLVAWVYVDGMPIVHLASVTDAPLRLPPIRGRVWNVQLYTNKEVFQVMLAQSAEELVSG